MLARHRWFTLAAALALGACGGSTPAGTTGTTSACGPATCAGCCDAQGKCQLPEAAHCGVDGAACRACAGNDLCSAGTCVVPQATSSGSGSTTTSGSSSGSSSASNSSTSGSSGTTTTGGSTSSTTTTGTTTTSSTGGTTGGDCCLSLNCPGGCDPGLCQCLGTSTSTTGTTTGGFDAGAICQSQNCVVYAESARTLYQVDPNPPNTLSTLCNFNGAIYPDAGVNDIAVNRRGVIYGITKNDVYSIDTQSCAGTWVATLASGHGQYNCLTFTDQDTLLAADANGQVVTIDITNGDVADAGRFGTNLGCSGDIVALSDGTVYATAKVLNDAGPNDLLVTLDPANGFHATPVSRNTLGYKSIFGLGYWAGTLYGFDRNGHTLAIDPVLGTSSLLHTNTGVVFYGAGTTPLAPVVTH